MERLLCHIFGFVQLRQHGEESLLRLPVKYMVYYLQEVFESLRYKRCC